MKEKSSSTFSLLLRKLYINPFRNTSIESHPTQRINHYNDRVKNKYQLRRKADRHHSWKIPEITEKSYFLIKYINPLTNSINNFHCCCDSCIINYVILAYRWKSACIFKQHVSNPFARSFIVWMNIEHICQILNKQRKVK